MTDRRRVSSRVSRRISLETQRNGPASSEYPARRSRGPGPFLVRSGSVYLFQIRVPKDLGGGRGMAPLRISLGARRASEARALAAQLAGFAQEKFREARMKKTADSEQSDTRPIEVEDLETLVAVSQMTGKLRAYAEFISQDLPPPTALEEKRVTALRGLVELGREVALGDRGHPIIQSKAHVLAASYADDLTSVESEPTDGGLGANKKDAATIQNPDPAKNLYAADALSESDSSTDNELQLAGEDNSAPRAPLVAHQDEPASLPKQLPPQPSLPNLMPTSIGESEHIHAPSPLARLGAIADDYTTPLPHPARQAPSVASAAGESDEFERDQDTRVHRIPLPHAAMPMQTAETAGASKPRPIALSKHEDRRFVARPASSHPTFCQIAAEYLQAYATKTGQGNRDLSTARMRCELFAELIGDHPVDTYNSADLQAYLDYLKYWPAKNNDRPADMSPWQIIEANKHLHHQPLSLKSIKEGYISVVKRVIRFKMGDLGYRDPFSGAKLLYPGTATPPQTTQPLSAQAISAIFKTGVEGGLFDEAFLPLLGNLTGRRLGLLIHLTGNDFREKYPDVWTASTSGLVKIDGTWRRVPYKTDASITFFVLHSFLYEIGFIEWARSKGEALLFPHFHQLADPSKSASQYMQRLWRRAGIEQGYKEVFHSLRSSQIEELRDQNIDARDRRLQVGHSVGSDQHDNYGHNSITERRARELSRLPLNPEINYDLFRGLDFEKMYRAKRIAGQRRK